MRWCLAFFRRPGRLLVLLTVVAIVIAASLLVDAGRSECSHAVLSRLPAPDSSWVAVLDEYTCRVGSPSAYTQDVLHVVTKRPVSTKLPANDIDLISVYTGGDASKRPRIAWSVPNLLRITVPLEDYLSHPNTSNQDRGGIGLSVDLRFNPDDPVVKDICRRWTGRPAGPVNQTTKP